MTNLELITDALRSINVISEIETPSPEQGTHALRKLNQMIESWTQDEVELGYFAQSLTTDELPLPPWAEKGVTALLAIELAPTYGASISAELVAMGEMGYQVIVRNTINGKLKPMNMNHLPTGILAL